MIARLAAQVFLKSAIRKGIGASSTLNILRKRGLGYRKSTFLSDFRELAGVPKKAEAIKYTPRKYRISKSNFTTGLDTQRHRFKFVAKVEYIDKDTGQLLEKECSTVGSYNLTKEQVEQEIVNSFEKNKDLYGNVTLTNVTFTEAYHRKGDVWF